MNDNNDYGRIPHLTQASTLSAISDHAMKSIWDRTPIDFQREAIPRLLMMRCVPYNPQALLLVQGTGGGKSAVAQTVGCVDCGVTVIIVETLALAADQRSKMSSANGIYGPILAYQLDSIKKKELVEKLKKKLLSMKKNDTTTVFLYTSPECLIRQPWRSLMVTLIDRGVMNLVCIDEIHLFVMFGITFRKEFTLLKSTFFRYLLGDNDPRSKYATGLCHDLKVPILLMTATFNNCLLRLLEKMIGVKVLPTNFLWAGREKMARRHICIDVSMTIQSTRYVKKILEATLSGNLHKKAIVYTNTAACLEQLRSDLELWMDMQDNIQGDVLIIQGDLQPEVKFVSAQQFTRHIEDPQTILDRNEYYPRILLATAGCIGAGLDSSDVFSVIRVGFPSGILDMVQELGRCGRGRITASGDHTDNFSLLLSLDDFVYLNQRLYLPAEKKSPSVINILSKTEEIKLQRSNLLELLKMIVLRGGCWHSAIEALIGNPLEPPAIDLTNCGDACPFCCDKIKEFVMPVSRVGMTFFLADVFITNAGCEINPALLVKKLTEFEQVGLVVYGRPRSAKSPPIKYVSVTILQLIASELIQLIFDEEKNACRCALVMVAASPAYLDDAYWTNMYLIETDNLN